MLCCAGSVAGAGLGAALGWARGWAGPCVVRLLCCGGLEAWLKWRPLLCCAGGATGGQFRADAKDVLVVAALYARHAQQNIGARGSWTTRHDVRSVLCAAHDATCSGHVE